MMKRSCDYKKFPQDANDEEKRTATTNSPRRSNSNGSNSGSQAGGFSLVRRKDIGWLLVLAGCLLYLLVCYLNGNEGYPGENKGQVQKKATGLLYAGKGQNQTQLLRKKSHKNHPLDWRQKIKQEHESEPSSIPPAKLEIEEEEDPCTIWLAPSSLKGNPGYGIFTTRHISKDDAVLQSGPDGLSIPLEDLRYDPKDYNESKAKKKWRHIWGTYAVAGMPSALFCCGHQALNCALQFCSSFQATIM